MQPHRPPTIVGVTTLFLALALACGGADEPDPDEFDEPGGTPSLGELLGAGPEAPSEPESSNPTTEVNPLPAELPDLVAEPVHQEPEVVETEDCTRARDELRSERARVDDRRAREITGAERALANGQLAMQNCLKTSPCNTEAPLMAAAQAKEEAGETAYQTAMQRVAQYEAGLFPYEQAVDRACGRR